MDVTLANILIVDDEEGMTDMISEVVEGLEMKFTCAFNLESALAFLHEKKYTTLILDMNILDARGEDIIDDIRKDTKSLNFDTPILIISGTLDKERVIGIRTKVQGVLIKPFNVDSVEKAILKFNKDKIMIGAK